MHGPDDPGGSNDPAGSGGRCHAPPRTVLLLPGQGAQRGRMAAGLYGADAAFTEAMDAFFTLLGVRGERLRTAWLRPRSCGALDSAATAQPLLFAVGHALGSALTARLPTAPALLLGHSVGELAAACLAGVFTPHGAARVLVARDTALRGAPAGGMTVVAAPARAVEPYLAPGVAVGAVNGPRQTVLCGPRAPLARTEGQLRAQGFTLRALRCDLGFHSPSLAAAGRALAAGLRAERAEADWRAPRLPLYSTRTARVVDADQARSPEFWSGQLAAPVLYWPALEALLAEQTAPGRELLLLDASPDRSLSAPARRHPAVRSGATRVLGLLPARGAGTDEDLRVFTSAVDAVRAAGTVGGAG